MYRVRFEVNGLERWLTSLHYEYFHPVSVDPEYYRQFLKKNFPYEPADALNGYPYNTSQVPLIKHRLIDEQIAYDCRKKLSFGVQAQGLENRFDTMLDPMEPDENKNIYYSLLARARHDAGLDRYLAPNFSNNYDRNIRPTEWLSAPLSHNRIGGLFTLTFGSSESDEAFYEWLLSGTMKEGRLVFHYGDGDPAFKIEFWDCFCVGIAEQMIANSPIPMMMYVRLSPAITRNRGVDDHKSWKITDPSSKRRASTPVPASEVVQEQVPESFESIYLINEKGQRIKEIDKEQNVTLVIKTKGKIGKIIKTVDLNNEEYDFLYNGVLLKDDRLSNYKITKDEERIALKAIKQQA